MDGGPHAAAAARASAVSWVVGDWHLARDCEKGTRQSWDIGHGACPPVAMSTRSSHTASWDARVVDSDNDPVVVVHANALLANSSQVAAAHADLRDPACLLTDPAVRSLVDFSQPVAILMVAVLHFVQDHEDPWALVRAYTAAMAPGSYLVISHVTGDGLPPEAIARAAEIYRNASAPGTARTHRDIARFFAGLDMAELGLTHVCTWRSADSKLSSRPAPSSVWRGSGASRTRPGGRISTPATPRGPEPSLQGARERAHPDPGPRWC